MPKFEKIPRPTRLGFLTYVGDVQGCGTIRVVDSSISYYSFSPGFVFIGSIGCMIVLTTKVTYL